MRASDVPHAVACFRVALLDVLSGGTPRPPVGVVKAVGSSHRTEVVARRLPPFATMSDESYELMSDTAAMVSPEPAPTGRRLGGWASFSPRRYAKNERAIRAPGAPEVAELTSTPVGSLHQLSLEGCKGGGTGNAH